MRDGVMVARQTLALKILVRIQAPQLYCTLRTDYFQEKLDFPSPDFVGTPRLASAGRGFFEPQNFSSPLAVASGNLTRYLDKMI